MRRNQSVEGKETYTHEESSSDQGAVSTVLGGAERERYCGVGWQERSSDSERDNRNGFYERDDVTRFGTIRLRIARTRGKNFLPAGLAARGRSGHFQPAWPTLGKKDFGFASKNIEPRAWRQRCQVRRAARRRSQRGCSSRWRAGFVVRRPRDVPAPSC